MELERAGSNDQVNVLVADHPTPRSRGTWFEIPPRSADGLARRRRVDRSTEKELDERLAEFLAFVLKRYPARHYLLVLWGHASGLNFGELRPGSVHDQVRLSDLAKVLAAFRRNRGGQKLEVLGFCACALSKAEFALELRDEVGFLVSSQIGISTLMTWPFDDIVKLVLTSPSVRPASFARQIVQTFEDAYEPPPVALTALDLQQSEALATQVNDLSETILAALAVAGDVGTLNNLCVLHAFADALEAHPYQFEPVVDFFDFCRKLVQEEHLDDAVRRKARDVIDRGFRSFVVQNSRSGPKLGALHGLSILAPDFDDPDWTKTCDTCSKQSSKAYFWRYTDWAKMTRVVHAFAMSRQELQDQ
jgi:hypothetical protein